MKHDISALLDTGRASGYQRWLVALTALTIVCDGIDNQLLGWRASSATCRGLSAERRITRRDLRTERP